MKWVGGSRLALHKKSNQSFRCQQWKSFKLARFRLACHSMVKCHHSKNSSLTQLSSRPSSIKNNRTLNHLSQDLHFYQSLQNSS